MEKLTIEGVIVVGINGDSVDSHQNFIDKHALNFSLLALAILIVAIFPKFVFYYYLFNFNS